MRKLIILLILVLGSVSGCKKDDITEPGILKLDSVPVWSVDNSRHEHSMQVICKLRYGDYIFNDSRDMVAAFIGEECTGYATPVQGDDPEFSLFLLTILGDSLNQQVSFKMYDGKNKWLMVADTTIYFIPSGILGTIPKPFEIFKNIVVR